jgi:heat shock protein HspQ
MNKTRIAKYMVGQVVRHRVFPFRGVVFDIDPVFNNTEEWYQSIPAEVRPNKDQPFYHLFAENAETEYIAYVSEHFYSSLFFRYLQPKRSTACIRIKSDTHVQG